MGFPTKNDHFGVFWGYHYLRKQPNGDHLTTMYQNDVGHPLWKIWFTPALPVDFTIFFTAFSLGRKKGQWQGKHQFEDGTCQLIVLIAQHPKPFGNDGWNILISRWCWVLTEKFTQFWSHRNASAYTSGRRTTKNLYTEFQDIKQKLYLQNISQLH